MRIFAATVILGLALSATAGAQPLRAEKLTPAESAWAKPLLQTWTSMNKGLKVVIAQASATNALIAGSGANNTKLTRTLVGFASCPAAVKKAGLPPSARLNGFDASMKAMCTNLAAGANDLAKAIGAVGKNDTATAKTQLTAAYAKFVKATTLLSTAGRQIVALGGQNIFNA